MKSFLFLSAFSLLSHFHGTIGEDVDSRMEAFLNESLAGLPNWIVEQGYIPDPLWGNGNITLQSTSEGRPFYNLTAEIKNRFYHGADKNIKALNIKSDMSKLTFLFDLGYGSGNSEFVEGDYSIRGNILQNPIQGEGTFRRTNQQELNQHVQDTCNLTVTHDGYFKFNYCEGVYFSPKFTNFTWSGSEGVSGIVSIVEAWYLSQITDFPNTIGYWYTYMVDVFATTPIVDIIGVTLPPTE